MARQSHIRLLITIQIVLLLLSSVTEAREIFEFYNGVRSLGMGGAYVTTVNDETALFHNPAALGKLRDPYLTIADPEFEVSARFTDYARLNNLSDMIDPQGILDVLKNHPGKPYRSRIQVSPSIVLPNFGFGLLGKYEYAAEVDSTGTSFSLRYRNDIAAALGYNFRLFNGIIKLGFNAKLINRVEIDETVPANSTGLSVNALASEGVGLSGDVGVLISAPVQWLPSLGVVARNVGGTSFTMGDGFFANTAGRRPAFLRQQYDASVALFPIVAKQVRASLTAELHDVLTEDTEEKKSLMRRSHAGVEFNFADFFFLRGGLNQKYWTAGLEFASERFQLQVATYGEDIGTPTASREDRRYVGKFSLRF